ncbi:MAG: hypothetical protein RR360_06960 [Raoultibacter sp.]
MECNTVTFTASDGKRVAFPLDFLIERGAIVADKVNGEDIISLMGCSNQLWIPGFPAKYFVRNISGIAFTKEEAPAQLPDFNDNGHDYTNRPNISCKANYIGYVGKTMLFEGWADDFDKKIVAVDFSLDGGTSWTHKPAPNTDAIRWVWWTFEWEPTIPGSYTVLVRAVNEDGVVSPYPASHSFEIVESQE